MKVIYKGEIELEDYLDSIRLVLTKYTENTKLSNPELEVSFVNIDGKIVEILEKDKSEAIIELPKISLDRTGPQKEKIIKYKDEKGHEHVFEQQELEKIRHLLSDGFDLIDIKYLLDYNFSQFSGIYRNFNYIEKNSVQNRKNAWEKYKHVFKEMNKRILFNEENLTSTYVKILHLYEDNYNNIRESNLNRQFKSPPVGYDAIDRHYYYDLALEAEARGTKLFTLDKITGPYTVFPDDVSKYTEIDRGASEKLRVGIYWDNDKSLFLNVLDINLICSKVNCYTKLQHHFIKHSELLADAFITEVIKYFVGYEISFRKIEKLYDIDEFMKHRQLKELTIEETKELIPKKMKSKIKYKRYSEGLKLYGIYNKSQFFYKFDPNIFEIPIVSELSPSKKGNEVWVHITDLHIFDEKHNNNFGVPAQDVKAFYAAKNMFLFEVSDPKFLEIWPMYRSVNVENI